MRIIAGKCKGRRLDSVADPLLKPIDDRVKEALFNILAPMLEKSLVCDLFAGSGAIGLEALSRGAQEVCFVEKNRHLQELIQRNIQKLHLEDQATLWRGDVLEAIPLFFAQKKAFDLIFIDPPYFDTVKEEAGKKGVQVQGLRKPKTDKDLLSADKEEKIAQRVLRLLDQYPIINTSGIVVIRTFKKYPLSTEKLVNMKCFREQRYGEALLSFFC